MARSVQQTQRQLIACALEVLADADFALAGSGAIREHGMTQRPTNDIDLFTVMQASARFPHAVDSLIELLQERDAGFDAGFFTECLRGARDITLTQVSAYGVNAPQLHAIQQRFRAWADDIDDQRNDQPRGLRDVLRAIPQPTLPPTRSAHPSLPTTPSPSPVPPQQGQGPTL